jgi:pyruvate,water dikinase
MDELNGGFASRIKEYEELIANQDKPSELLQVYESIRTDIMEDWDITLINDMYTFIYTALVGKKNKELISNIKNLESMKPVYALRELQDIAEGFGVNSEKYRTAVETYIAQYGDRCLCELKLETRTYRTNPELLEDYILRKCERGKIKRKVAEENDCKDGFFIKRAKIGIKNREISRMNRSRIFGLARTIFDKIGTYMVSNNLLDVAEDVYYLYIDELYTMQDYRHLVLKRKAEQTAFANIPAYSRLVFSDNVINKQNYGGQSRILKQNNELWGIATSVGKVRGEALVIDEPSDKIDSTGKILITKSTDPGWVFLIQNASGIIAEKGSLLSHTAIISRELCKPAIVNVKDCTKLIHSGDIVELDAECGCVTILSEGCPICEK